jgi:hypothetical protein
MRRIYWSPFKLLKMPPWWHHVFALMAPQFCHGGTMFSWKTISFSGQCPKTWHLNGCKKMQNGICNILGTTTGTRLTPVHRQLAAAKKSLAKHRHEILVLAFTLVDI